MSHQWYFVIDDQKHGPLTDDELKERAASKHIGPTDLIWRQGLPEWVEAQTIEGLVFGKLPPTAGGRPAPVSASGSHVVGAFVGCVLVFLAVAFFCAQRYGVIGRLLHPVPGKAVASSPVGSDASTNREGRIAENMQPAFGKVTTTPSVDPHIDKPVFTPRPHTAGPRAAGITSSATSPGAEVVMTQPVGSSPKPLAEVPFPSLKSAVDLVIVSLVIFTGHTA